MFQRLKGKGEETEGNPVIQDYDRYTMGVRERALYTGAAALVVYGVAYVFYHSHILCLAALPLSLLYPSIRTRRVIENRKLELGLQFKDLLYSIASSLAAGKSVEVALREAMTDLEVLYPREDTCILIELRYILHRIEMNETIEAAFADLAHRSGQEDIQSFAEVFYICNRSGGNIVEVIRNTSNMIRDKLEIAQEIKTLLSERKMEQKVLNALPVLMLLLLSATAGEYMAPVFETAAGRVVMTGSILLLAVAYLISRRITNIKL